MRKNSKTIDFTVLMS